MPICEYSLSTPTHPSLLSVLLFAFYFIFCISFSLKDIIPWLSFLTSSVSFTPPLPFLYVCLLVSSSMFSEPLLTHSLFASSLCLSLLTTWSHLPQRFHLFLFQEKNYTLKHKIDIHTSEDLHTPPLLSFYLLPFTLSLLQPRSPGKWISIIYDEALSELLPLFPPLSVSSPWRIKMTLILSPLPM